MYLYTHTHTHTHTLTHIHGYRPKIHMLKPEPLRQWHLEMDLWEIIRFRRS